MIKISAVSYLNTKPFIYGLLRSSLASQIDLQLDIPSECARKLKAGEVDLALTPIAILPELEHYQLVSDFCIGAQGKVQTVCIYSQVPIEAVEAIYLDFHSRTSAMLTRILCKHFWKVEVEFLQSQEGYFSHIKGKTAGLIIGDRTIGKDKNYAYCYDLAEMWKEWTGLPFVFAAWVSTKPLDPDFVQEFNLALAAGLDLIPELIKILPTVSDFNMEKYFREAISYDFTEAKHRALELYLEHLETITKSHTTAH